MNCTSSSSPLLLLLWSSSASPSPHTTRNEKRKKNVPVVVRMHSYALSHSIVIQCRPQLDDITFVKMVLLVRVFDVCSHIFRFIITIYSLIDSHSLSFCCLFFLEFVIPLLFGFSFCDIRYTSSMPHIITPANSLPSHRRYLLWEITHGQSISTFIARMHIVSLKTQRAKISKKEKRRSKIAMQTTFGYRVIVVIALHVASGPVFRISPLFLCSFFHFILRSRYMALASWSERIQ